MLIIDNKGTALKSTLSHSETVEYSSLINQFATKAKKALKEIHPDEELIFVRIRSVKNEIVIAPDN